MAKRITLTERLELGANFRRAYSVSWFVGGIGLGAAIVFGFIQDSSFRRFFFAYLVSYMFFLSISLGALLYVLVQHLTRAGWSVATRRVAENLTCALPMLGALSAPILLSVILYNGALYPWAQRATAHDAQVEHSESTAVEKHDGSTNTHPGPRPINEVTLRKRAWLNPFFFIVRVLLYLAVFSGLGLLYWKWSVQQDVTADVELTHAMQRWSAPALLLTFLILTFAAFDLLMSLDPAWFSTMFGVYYFSGCAVAIFATLILMISLLQRSGCLTQTITTEHYHDLGKFLFAFTFFWGYIAFSQYMLIWYAAIPEETIWLVRRGASSSRETMNAWTGVCILLLAGHLLIPFAGLLSRHVKRNTKLLVFWAAWMLVFHWIDLFWLVMPEYESHVRCGPTELLCLIGLGGLYLATVLRIGLRHNLRPVHDPRLEESLAFENV
jgi:hypothetical protein